MSQTTFNKTAGIIFSVVFIVHGLRILNNWGLVIGGWAAPMWLSVFGVILTGLMAHAAWKLPR